MPAAPCGTVAKLGPPCPTCGPRHTGRARARHGAPCITEPGQPSPAAIYPAHTMLPPNPTTPGPTKPAKQCRNRPDVNAPQRALPRTAPPCQPRLNVVLTHLASHPLPCVTSRAQPSQTRRDNPSLRSTKPAHAKPSRPLNSMPSLTGRASTDPTIRRQAKPDDPRHAGQATRHEPGLTTLNRPCLAGHASYAALTWPGRDPPTRPCNAPPATPFQASRAMPYVALPGGPRPALQPAPRLAGPALTRHTDPADLGLAYRPNRTTTSPSPTVQHSPQHPGRVMPCPANASLTQRTIRSVPRHGMNCDSTLPARLCQARRVCRWRMPQTPLSHRRTTAADHSSDVKRRGSV